MLRVWAVNFGRPIVGLWRVPRRGLWLPWSSEATAAMCAMGMVAEIGAEGAEPLELDSVPELSVTEERGGVSVELTLTTRSDVGADDALLVCYDSAPWLLVGWHPVHHGETVRMSESTGPRREGPPVTYTHRSAVPPIAVTVKGLV